MQIRPRAEAARLAELFPAEIPLPDPGVFELGLVLGGTGSAGAYTAGALDFLLEALEAWHISNPPHRVVIKTASATSGGAVCAAMLGILSSRIVRHVTGTQEDLVADDAVTGNPLWDIWVNDFDISKVLATTDIDSYRDADAGTEVRLGQPPAGDGTPTQHVPSLLDSRMIDEAGDTLITFANAPSTVVKPYFAAPFRIAVTLSNLRGIPFNIRAVPAYDQFTGSSFLEHDDFAWFAFPNGTSITKKREDEFWLAEQSGSETSAVVSYRTLADFVAGSAATPGGLVARALSRPAEHYLYRPIVRPVPQAPGYAVEWINPDWSELPDVEASGVYRFTSVDGGAFNNNPVTLAHRALAGLIGRNPRGSSEATRAILMIDPLADQPTAIASTGTSLIRVLGTTFNLFLRGTNYLTADMDLFRQRDVFSRFQLVPTRPEPGRIGEKAVIGSRLGTLAGWCARGFRVHDYLLGRTNMQAYLRSELTLAGDNGLFRGWSVGLRQAHAADVDGRPVAIDADTPGCDYRLPVLPDLTGTVAPMPAWPVGACDPRALHTPIVRRLEAVLTQLRTDNLRDTLERVASIVAVPGIDNIAATAIVDAFIAQLEAAGLLAPDVRKEASDPLSG